MSPVLFLLTALAVLALIHTFLYRSLVGGLGIRSRGVRWTLGVVLGILAVSYPLARWLEHFAPDAVVYVTHATAGLWIGFMFHALWIALDLWLLRTLLRLVGLWKKGSAAHARVARLAVVLTVVAALVLSGVGLAGARQPARVREVLVPVEHLADVVASWRIAVLSDLHAGVLVDAEEVARRVDEVLALEPDLILIPGDVLDHPPGRLEAAAAELARLRAPQGVYVTTGNHEYYVGVEASVALLEEVGLRVLASDHVTLPGGLVVAGVEDPTADRMGRPRPAVEAALGDDAQRVPTILLLHTPHGDEVAAAIEAGADLCVSGHTHGGQIWPFSLFTKLAFPYHHGLYRVGDGWQLTTCGIGWWGPPMRLGTSPEILLVRLVPADHDAVFGE